MGGLRIRFLNKDSLCTVVAFSLSTVNYETSAEYINESAITIIKPKTEKAMAEFFKVTIYTLLVFLWFAIFLNINSIFSFGVTKVTKKRIRLKLALQIFAFIIFLDSAYWAVIHISSAIDSSRKIELLIRTDFLVGTIKFLVLLSALIFWYILSRTKHSIEKEYEDAYFSKFVDLTWDAIGVLDSDGRVKYWNLGAEKLFGWKRNEVIGKSINTFLVPKEYIEETKEILGQVKIGKEPVVRFDTIRLTSTGQRIKVDITSSAILDPDFKGFFGIMRKSIQKNIIDYKYFTLFESPTTTPPYIFVAMPFSEAVVPKEVYTDAIRPSIEQNDLTALRIDYQITKGTIINQIFNDIRFASIVIVEMTGQNPNVFYELGMAHTLGKPVIPLMVNNTKIPFDVAGFPTIYYDQNDLNELREKLAYRIKMYLSD